MGETITILPDKEWLTTAEVAQALQRSERVIQQMAKDGVIKWKLAGSPYSANARLYEAKDVRNHLPTAPKPHPSPSSINRRIARKIKDTDNASNAVRVAPSGTEIMVAKEFAGMMRDVVEKLLTESKQQRESPLEAGTKRLEYEKQRWEIERSERLLREKSWLTPQECHRLQGLPASAVKELAEQGKLDGVRVGSGWRIRRASLEAFSG